MLMLSMLAEAWAQADAAGLPGGGGDYLGPAGVLISTIVGVVYAVDRLLGRRQADKPEPHRRKLSDEPEFAVLESRVTQIEKSHAEQRDDLRAALRLLSRIEGAVQAASRGESGST